MGTALSAEHEGRARARELVSRELARRQMNPAEFARSAGLDNDTVADFLSGKRWPQLATRSKIATGLGWREDGIDMAVRLMDPEPLLVQTVGPVDQDAGVLASLPPEALAGLDEADRAEVIAAAKLSALEKAREIRRRLGE